MWTFGWLRRRVSSAGLAVLVALVGAVVSAGGGTLLALGQRDAAIGQLDRRTTATVEAVTTEAGRYVDTLRTVAAAVGAFETLTAAKFDQAVRPLADMRLAGAASVVFLVPAADSEVAATQEFWRGRGVPDLRLTPVGAGREHLFSVFSVPLDGVTTPRYGVDASQATPAAQALNEARRTGRPAISTAYQLIIDQGLPPDQRQMSFSLTAPVHDPPDAQGRRPFRGWVLMGLRGRDFIGATLDRVGQELIDVALLARDNNGVQVPVADLRAPVRGTRDLSRRIEVPVADRQWELRVRAVGLRLPGGSTGLPSVVTGAGILLGLVLAGLVYVLATGRARAQAQVRRATADLARAEGDARRQTDLLTAILDSISDGVGVVDERGEFILHNPAAKAILGQPEDRGGTEHWQDHYGIFRPDGRTPFPTDELPLVRALSGESSEQVEMIIRNPGQPDGVTITVSGRPLTTGDGRTGAVAVFHDITERKVAEAELAATIDQLRERKAELRSFAGVVAHDLKSPLSVIAGYSDLLDETLDTGADPTALRPILGRVRTGVERMRRLIDDLLAYATARDGKLNATALDLQAMVNEIVTEHTAALRSGHADADRSALFPDIYTGALPMLNADPVLVRQLLTNLIGNAIKYTLPGQPARIDISAHHDTAGWVRIQIADRGTGIPAADQPHVFDTFHRSARHIGYTGTGLGLAICKRVVDRHGGTIGVSDNPGGGTRVNLTVPTAPPPEPQAEGVNRHPMPGSVIR